MISQEMAAMTLEDTSAGKLKNKEESMTLEEVEQQPVELFTLGKYRGIKTSGVKFLTMLKFPPILAARRQGMLCMGSYFSPETAALAHDIAAYNLYGPQAVFNFPHVIRTCMGLKEGDQEIPVVTLTLERCSGKRKVEDGTHANSMKQEVDSGTLEHTSGKLKRKRLRKRDGTHPRSMKVDTMKMKQEVDSRTLEHTSGQLNKGNIYFRKREWSEFHGIKKLGDDKFMVGGMISLGSFDSPETAAFAYDIAVYNLYGRQAVLNFPDQFHIAMRLPAQLARARAKAKAKVTPPSDGGQNK